MKQVVIFASILATFLSSFTAYSETMVEKTVQTSDRGKLIIIGASYAKGWKIDRLAGYDVINMGVGGQQTSEVLARFENDVLRQEPAPKVVVIWGFINDIFRSAQDEIDEKKKQAKANIEKMIDLSSRNHIKTVLVTEVTITSPDSFIDSVKDFIGGLLGKESYQQRINKHVIEINKWLREKAAKEGLLLLDFEQQLADSDGSRKKVYASKDGSHLSHEAYDVLSAYVRTLESQF